MVNGLRIEDQESGREDWDMVNGLWIEESVIEDWDIEKKSFMYQMYAYTFKKFNV